MLCGCLFASLSLGQSDPFSDVPATDSVTVSNAGSGQQGAGVDSPFSTVPVPTPQSASATPPIQSSPESDSPFQPAANVDLNSTTEDASSVDVTTEGGTKISVQRNSTNVSTDRQSPSPFNFDIAEYVQYWPYLAGVMGLGLLLMFLKRRGQKGPVSADGPVVTRAVDPEKSKFKKSKRFAQSVSSDTHETDDANEFGSDLNIGSVVESEDMSGLRLSDSHILSDGPNATDQSDLNFDALDSGTFGSELTSVDDDLDDDDFAALMLEDDEDEKIVVPTAGEDGDLGFDPLSDPSTHLEGEDSDEFKFDFEDKVLDEQDDFKIEDAIDSEIEGDGDSQLEKTQIVMDEEELTASDLVDDVIDIADDAEQPDDENENNTQIKESIVKPPEEGGLGDRDLAAKVGVSVAAAGAAAMAAALPGRQQDDEGESLRNTIAELKEKLSSQQSKFDRTVTGLETELSTAKDQAKELASAQGECSAAQDELALTQNQLSATEEKLSVARDEVAAAKDELIDVQQQKTEIQKQLQDTQSDLMELQEKHQELEAAPVTAGQLAEVEQKNAVLQSDLAASSEANSAAMENIELLKSEKEQMAEDLESKSVALEKADQIKSELDQTKEVVKQLEAEIEEAYLVKKETASEFEGLNSTIAELKTENETLAQSLKETKSQLEEATEQLVEKSDRDQSDQSDLQNQLQQERELRESTEAMLVEAEDQRTVVAEALRQVRKELKKFKNQVVSADDRSVTEASRLSRTVGTAETEVAEKSRKKKKRGKKKHLSKASDVGDVWDKKLAEVESEAVVKKEE
jgi:hypothetical protein